MKHIFLNLILFLQVNVAIAQCVELHLVENFDTTSKLKKHYNLSFPHKDTGWVVNFANDKLLKTCDGGKSWEVQLDGNGSMYYPFDCKFINTREGWVSNIGQKEREVLYTKDGGKTWAKQKSNLGLGLGKSGRLFGLFFFNNKEGLLGGDSTIWKTNDGGVTWLEKSKFTYPVAGYRSAISSFTFTNNTTGYGCSATETTHRTIDKGETWSILDNINNDYPSSGEGMGFYTMYCISEKRAVYAGTRSFRYTKDGGKTWKAIADEKELYLRGIAFTDSLTGWVGLYANFKNSIYFYHTKDAGETWQKIYLNGDYPYGIGINNMQFVTKKMAYIVANSNFYKMYVDTIPLCKTKLLNHEDSIFTNKSVLKWKNAKNCTEGYKINIGTTPYGTELYNKYDVKNDTFWQLPKPLPSNSKVFVTIIPYNQYGDGEVCTTAAIQTEKTINTNDLPNEIASAVVYPNPFSNLVNIEMTAYKRLQLQGFLLANTTGQIVFQQTFSESLDIGSCTKSIDLSHFPIGTYFLKIKTDKGSWRTVIVHI